MLSIEERLARLEKAAGKSETVSKAVSLNERKFDPLANYVFDPETRREFAQAVGERVPGEIAREQSRPVSPPAVHARSPGKAGSNWKEPAPLKVFGTENLGKKREA
jgi:hypothetical protein